MIEKKNKIQLLDSSATLFFPVNSKIKIKDPSTIEVSFSKDKYPLLGINLQCFDNPKLNSEIKIKEFLIDDEDISFGFKRKGNTFILNYEIKVEMERLVIYKVLSVLKPRTFRLLRFALTWPDNQSATKITKPILEAIPEIINNIKFNSKRTKYDELASLDYNLYNAKLRDYSLWDIIKLKIPLKWNVEHSKEHDFATVFMDFKSNYNFLIEKFFVSFNKNKGGNTDKLVENFIQEITKEVNISDAKFKKADENNYLFYFLASEKDLNDSSKINNSKIWYRIKVLEDKIVIISFVFELISHIELENELYLEKLNKIIGSSEILV